MSSLPFWLDEPFGLIDGMVAADRIPPALLLHGDAGWGLEILADSVAVHLLEVEGSARELTLPDLRWIEPQRKTISVDEVRLLIEFAQQSAVNRPRKVAVLCDADRMTIAAANALLKILEEPPENMHILLVTTDPTQLPATILSRCQRVRIPCASRALVKEWISERGFETDRRLNGFLVEHGDAPLNVLGALESGEISVRDDLLQVWNHPQAISEVAQRWRDLDVRDVLHRWQRIVHQTAIGGVKTKSALRFYDELVDRQRMIADLPSLNSRLQYERLLHKWLELRPSPQERVEHSA